MAAHSSVLAYGQRSLAGYSPCGRKRVGQDLVTYSNTAQDEPDAGFTQIIRKVMGRDNYKQPLPPLFQVVIP